MCLIGIALSVAVTVTNAVPLAEYRHNEIRVNPAVCEYPAETQAFILAHEYAHHTEKHLSFVGVLPTKEIELDADTKAIAMVKALGYDTCNAVKPVLHFRGWFSISHPNQFTLQRLACGE